MATCIVSRAMQLVGAAALSGILLAAGIAAYLVLAAVYAGRLAINRPASAPTRPILAARSASSRWRPARTCWPPGWRPTTTWPRPRCCW
jgi:hypothetical protein